LASESRCPMETAMMAMALAGDLDSADLSDCCNDLQTWAETGHLCKSGIDCPVFTAWLSASVARDVHAAPSSGIHGAPHILVPTGPSGSPWRPPSPV